MGSGLKLVNIQFNMVLFVVQMGLCSHIEVLYSIIPNTNSNIINWSDQVDKLYLFLWYNFFILHLSIILYCDFVFSRLWLLFVL